MPEPRRPQTPEEIRQHAEHQLGFLIDACERFDAGEEHYEKPIATALRVLLHDTRNSHSLLEQLGRIGPAGWLDTAGPVSALNIMSQNNLATLSPNTGTYLALLDGWQPGPREARESAFGRIVNQSVGRTLPFDEWWDMAVVRDSKWEHFSRRDLVLIVANQDGGAHVDPALDEAYYRLTRENSSGWRIMPAGDEEWTPAASPVPASLRQIAHEVLRSLPHGMHPGKTY